MFKFILLLSLVILTSCSNEYDKQWHDEQMQIVQHIFEKQMEIKPESINCIGGTLSEPNYYKYCNALMSNGFPVKYTCYSRGWHNQRKHCTLN
jgi:menaquinone-dependent protoporphyrinogen IX oxidase